MLFETLLIAVVIYSTILILESNKRLMDKLEERKSFEDKIDKIYLEILDKEGSYEILSKLSEIEYILNGLSIDAKFFENCYNIR